LKKVDRGDMTVSTALKKISDAKAKAENMRRLLRESGQRDEQTALTHRYAEAMSAPVDLSDEANTDHRGKLLLALSDLMQMLERDFLK
jgi:hypothetical protein